jgi:hypothetical protein
MDASESTAALRGRVVKHFGHPIDSGELRRLSYGRLAYRAAVVFLGRLFRRYLPVAGMGVYSVAEPLPRAVRLRNRFTSVESELD